MSMEKQCPWCEGLAIVESEYRGDHGLMKVIRCADCHKLISVRLKGEPDQIFKKELIEKRSL